MSWRADRLNNLRDFASANGGDPDKVSPELQAKFFLNEDPNLIASLEQSQSPEDAQRLMNNAWRFAGYNREGGEAGRRIGLARQFASDFGGGAGGRPVQTASLDPSIGVPQAYAQERPQQAAGAPARYPTPGMASTPPVAPMPPVQPTFVNDDGWQGQHSGLAGFPPAPPPPQFPAAPQQYAGGGPSMEELYSAYSDPRTDDNTRAFIEMAIRQRQDQEEREREQNDPYRRMQLEKGQLELDQARNPGADWEVFEDPSGDRYRYDKRNPNSKPEMFYDAPAKAEDRFRTLTPDEVKLMGLPPNAAYQMGADGKISQIGGGGTVVNVGGEGGYKVPAGYMQVDPNSPEAGVKPIPGGPGEQIPSELAARLGLADNFLSQLPSIRERVKGGGVTGPIDYLQANNNSSSDSADIYRKIESGAEAVQRMLTGAGMNANEAANNVRRYLPSFTDTADSVASKLDSLKPNCAA